MYVFVYVRSHFGSRLAQAWSPGVLPRPRAARAMAAGLSAGEEAPAVAPLTDELEEEEDNFFGFDDEAGGDGATPRGGRRRARGGGRRCTRRHGRGRPLGDVDEKNSSAPRTRGARLLTSGASSGTTTARCRRPCRSQPSPPSRATWPTAKSPATSRRTRSRRRRRGRRGRRGRAPPWPAATRARRRRRPAAGSWSASPGALGASSTADGEGIITLSIVLSFLGQGARWPFADFVEGRRLTLLMFDGLAIEGAHALDPLLWRLTRCLCSDQCHLIVIDSVSCPVLLLYGHAFGHASFCTAALF